MHLLGLAGGIGSAATILENQRNLALAGHQCQRATQRAFVVVGDFDQAEQSPVRLATGESMRMRVIPIKRRAIA